jgi:pantoate--beta-alanine ligase
MKVARTTTEFRRIIDQSRGRGETRALVPTMGYLHQGHLSLFERARRECGVVIASIFVNPLQFGASEDLESYPDDLGGDLEKAERSGVDIVFAPSTGEMYPRGNPLVTIDPGPMAQQLCGRYRPGHFVGVLTVVAKLFHLSRPDVAVFGRKDLQQGVLIRRMTEDLDIPIHIVLSPIVREADGLAMSSRNAFLGNEDRRQATGISGGLLAVSKAFAEGTTDPASLLGVLDEHLLQFPGLELQYAEFVSPESLEHVDTAGADTVLAVAAFCGGTRLIDNRSVGDPDG